MSAITRQADQQSTEPHFEIERKFLVESLPRDFDHFPRQDITQGYIAITETGKEVRLRKKGSKYFLTVKTGSLKIRLEQEIEITREQFEQLWSTTEDRILEKIRYKIPYGGVTIELDVYQGKLKGLCLAEVEFKSEADANIYRPPTWLGLEVTMNLRYKNQQLALYGLPSKV